MDASVIFCITVKQILGEPAGSELFLHSSYKHIHIHFCREIHVGNICPVSGIDRCFKAGFDKN